MIDGYFINPEGNLGHPVAYTLNLTHKHTYTNHSRKTIHIGRTCSQGVGCIQILYRYWTDITVCIDCVSVDVHKGSSAKSASVSETPVPYGCCGVTQLVKTVCVCVCACVCVCVCVCVCICFPLLEFYVCLTSHKDITQTASR